MGGEWRHRKSQADNDKTIVIGTVQALLSFALLGKQEGGDARWSKQGHARGQWNARTKIQELRGVGAAGRAARDARGGWLDAGRARRTCGRASWLSWGGRTLGLGDGSPVLSP
jgi:hypothetical protein